jgi:protein-S-isoprenylcysteine O-methyltransferase Ste14
VAVLVVNPAYAKAVVLAASVAMVIIRAPHGRRSRTVKTLRSRKGGLEIVLLFVAWLSFFLPLLWCFKPIFRFADYPLHPAALAAGVAFFVVGLWIFHLSHKHLGEFWSITLEVREKHRLITDGVYRRVRHPMYLALFLYSIGQLLALPNWVVGPSYLLGFGLLFALRIGAEERMMREEFPQEYESYAARTKRLIPGIW